VVAQPCRHHHLPTVWLRRIFARLCYLMMARMLMSFV
jgi:hypothetical protein